MICLRHQQVICITDFIICLIKLSYLFLKSKIKFTFSLALDNTTYFTFLND